MLQMEGETGTREHKALLESCDTGYACADTRSGKFRSFEPRVNVLTLGVEERWITTPNQLEPLQPGRVSSTVRSFETDCGRHSCVSAYWDGGHSQRKIPDSSVEEETTFRPF
jgi:hypothetical protein